MTKITKTRAIAASLIAASGLASLSPVQQAATGLAMLGAVGVASPAWAQNTIPGVGTVVKKKPGNSYFVVPSDANGNTMLSGLEPGDYEVKLAGAAEAITVPVGADGQLAVTAWEDKGRRWVEPAKAPVRGAAIHVPRTFPAPARVGATGYIDVNTSSAADITRLAPGTSAQAAEAIVAERGKARFTGVGDFAKRVCSKTSVDFGFAPTQIGSARIIARASGPTVPGLRCSPGQSVEIYELKGGGILVAL